MNKQALKLLGVRAHEINTANGFDVPVWDTLPIKLMLVVSELDETADAEPRPAHFAEELADAAIRLLSILTALWPKWTVRVGVPITSKWRRFDRIEVMLWPVITHLCSATEYWRDNNEIDAGISLELAVREVCSIADRLDIDLEYEIKIKLEKNASRGKCHGRARSEG